MSRDWKKYGSPYDPGYMGKSKRPQEQKAQDQERYQLRGCGDPSCAMCNPETAMSIGRLNEDVIRRLMGASADRGGVFSISLDDFARLSGSAQPKSGPPSSYVEARKNVEQFICKVPSQDFTDIIGNEEALEQLKDAIQAPVVHAELYKAYSMKMPKGALLYGPPGCGKTMFARAAASEMSRLYGSKDKEFEFLSLSGSELQTMYVGQTEAQIKALFVFAREYKEYHGYPLLIFMDECEVILPDRTGRVRRVAPWEESQVATFIAEMDGMQESGAFMLLATNRPEVIDQAVLRDGRCDFKVEVKRPTREAVEVIIRKNFEKEPLHTVGLDELVFAAVESLYDPHKIIQPHRALFPDFDKQEMKDVLIRHFCLEHILSGAMAASVPQRAKRHAFSRDKLSDSITGIGVDDVVKAVNDLFEENKELEHSFAIEEFRDEFLKDANNAAEKFMAEKRGKLN